MFCEIAELTRKEKSTENICNRPAIIKRKAHFTCIFEAISAILQECGDLNHATLQGPKGESTRSLDPGKQGVLNTIIIVIVNTIIIIFFALT